MLQPPQGSKIQIDVNGGADRLILPHKPAGVAKYIAGFVVILCLFASIAMTPLMMKVEFDDNSALSALALFPLAMIGAANLLAFYTAYRTFKPPVPETLTLASSGISYDSGKPAYYIASWRYSQAEAWKLLFVRRFQLEITPEQIKTLMLYKLPEGNRLTLDAGIKRIEIGKGLSDIEREWLYAVIREKYGLPIKKETA